MKIYIYEVKGKETFAFREIEGGNLLRVLEIRPGECLQVKEIPGEGDTHTVVPDSPVISREWRNLCHFTREELLWLREQEK